ncbi:MAG: hypothetical protein ABW184_08960 [Sphingobium sp.]
MVNIQAGAQINAPVNGSSYVALFAPAIRQNGEINVNGSTAMVAAGAGRLTWNAGLFNVEVSVGTDGDSDGVAIRHGGSTGGPASGSDTDFHRVYMVSVPRNSAITTLIEGGSSLGFDVAGAANEVGNAVILTTGYDLASDTVVQSAALGTGTASISATDFTATSGIELNALNTVQVSASAAGAILAAGDLTVVSPADATVQADGSSATINVGGDLSILANKFGSGSDTSIVGGNAVLSAINGGQIVVAGEAALDSSVRYESSGSGGQALGGSARVEALSGGSIEIAGDLELEANGQARDDGSTKLGTGGRVELVASGGGTDILVGGGLTMEAFGLGGSAQSFTTDGGDGVGGFVNVIAEGGIRNRIRVDGAVNLDASGFGGNASGDGTVGGGRGQEVLVSARAGGTIDFLSDANLIARGESGMGDGSFGGTTGRDASGGSARLESMADDAVISVGGDLAINAGAKAQELFFGATPGGVATGGTARLIASRGAITVSGPTQLLSVGEGGSGTSNNSGFGGTVEVLADVSGTLTLNNSLDFFADGLGGVQRSGISGNGTGGSAILAADGTGNIGITGPVTGTANGTGGEDPSGNGSVVPGNGFGKEVVIAQRGSGQISFGDAVLITANGRGPGVYTGTPVGQFVTGGRGEGGVASVTVSGTGGISFASSLGIAATGMGGEVFAAVDNGNGGEGRGGTTRLEAVGDGEVGRILLSGSVTLDASGIGGGIYQPGTAGEGIGGASFISASGGGSIIAEPGTFTHFFGADAVGGSAFSDGTGGAATAGRVEVRASVGTITLTETSLSAFASGGSGGSVGMGGAAFGGVTSVIADDDGLLNFIGSGQSGRAVYLVSSSQGGFAFGSGGGGDAVAGSARMIAASGGRLSIEGAALLGAIATGGNGTLYGGIGDGRLDATGAIGADSPYVVDGLAPTLLVYNDGGRVDIGGQLSLEGSATGGTSNQPGGDGGNAFAGTAAIITRANGESATNIGALAINLDGFGGVGGAASASSTSEPNAVGGGRGGDAHGGLAVVMGQAGGGYTAGPSGLLTIDDLRISAGAVAGRGGSGQVTFYQGGRGGDGGIGGDGFAGTVRLGADSIAGSSSTGGAAFGDILVGVGASGGLGGPGGAALSEGEGTPGENGNGGAGGSAFGGTTRGAASGIYALGAPVATGAIGFTNLVQGGQGGFGEIIGIGGDSQSGAFDVIVTGRTSGERGTFTAGAVSAILSSQEGDSPVRGVSRAGLGPIFSVENGDVDLAAFNVVQDGLQSGLGLVSPEARIILRNAEVTVGENFDFTLQGPAGFSIFADNSRLSAGTINLNAYNFVTDTVNGTPVSPASLSANDITINTSTNLVLSTDLDAASSLTLNAPSGFINGRNLRSANDISVSGGLSITLLDLTAGGEIDLDGNGGVTIRDAVAGSGFSVEAAGGVTTGAVDAGASVFIQSGGETVLNGPVTAGIVNPATGSGLRYDIGIYGALGIETGDLTAAQRIGVIADTGRVQGGVFSAARDILILSGGEVALRGIESAGGDDNYVYIANSSMASLGGQAGDFNPFPIFLSTPLAVAGDVAIATDVSAGNFRSASIGNFSAADITARGFVEVSANNILAGTMTAPGAVVFSAQGSLTLDAVTGGAIILGAAGPMAAGNLISDGDIVAFGEGAVAFGDLRAGQNIDVGAVGAVKVGSLRSGANLFLRTDGDLTAGAIDAGDRLVVSGGDVTITGPATAGIVRPANGPDALYTLAIAASGSLDTGSLGAANDILLYSGTGSVTTGEIVAGRNALALAGGDVTLGGASVSQLYIGSSSMLSMGELLETLNPSFLYAQPPVALSGTIGIAGPVAVGQFSFASLGDVALGDVQVDEDLIGSGGSFTGGSVVAGGNIALDAAGSMALGLVESGRDTTLIAGGDISAESVTAGRSLAILSGGALDIARGVEAGFAPPGGMDRLGPPDGIILRADGDIRFGAVDALTSVNLISTNGAIRGVASQGQGGGDGGIRAGGDVLLLASTGVSVSSIAAASGGSNYVTIADSSMASLGGAVGDFDAAPIFLASPVAMAGDVRIANDVSGGNLVVRTSGDFGVRNLTAGGRIDIGADGIAGGAVSATGSASFGAAGALTLSSVSGNGIDLSAGGVLTSGNLVSGAGIAVSGADVVTHAGLTAAGAIAVQGQGVTSGPISAGGDILIDVAGNLTLVSLVGGGNVDLTSGGDMAFTSATAGDSVVVQSGGAVDIAGSLSAGLVNPVSAPGAIYGVIVSADGAIRFGAARARGSIGLISQSAAIAGQSGAGGIEAGGDVLLLAATGVSTGGISAATDLGRFIYVADSSMAALGSAGAGFDPAQIFATAPVALAGDVRIGGDVSGGNFVASTTGDLVVAEIDAAGRVALNGNGLSAGSVRASGSATFRALGGLSLGAVTGNGVDLGAGGVLTAGALTSGADIIVAGSDAVAVGALNAVGSIAISGSGATGIGGAISAGGGISLTTPGNLSLGTLVGGEDVELTAGGNVAFASATAGDSVVVRSGGAVDIAGLVSAGIVNPVAGPDAPSYGIIVTADRTLRFGGMAAGGGISLVSANGAIYGIAGQGFSGGLSAGGDVLLLASTGVSVSGITAASGSGNYVTIADSSMASLGGVVDDFDAAPIFLATPVAMTGGVRIANDVSGGNLVARTTGDFGVRNLTAGGRVDIGAAGIVAGAVSATGSASFGASGTLTLGSVSANGIDLSAGGALTSGNLVSGGSIAVSGQNAVTLAGLTAAGAIAVQGQGATGIGGTISAGGDISLATAGGLSLGTLSGGGTIALTTGGDLAFASATAGDSVLVRSGGTVDIGDVVSAGIVNPVTTPGAAHAVFVAADGTIRFGGVRALGGVNLISANGAIAGVPSQGQSVDGGIAAGGDVLLLASTGVSVSGITAASTAGRNILIANGSMASLGVTPAGGFDPAPIFAAAPVAVGGDVLIANGLSGGNVIVRATGDFRTADIAAGGRLDIGANAIAAGAVDAVGGVTLRAAGALSLGAVTGNGVDLGAGGALVVGDLTSGSDIVVTGAGAVTLGALDAGRNIAIDAGATDIGGAISASGDISLTTPGGLSLGTLVSGGDILLDAGQDVAFTTATAGDSVIVLSGGGVDITGSVRAGIVNPATTPDAPSYGIIMAADGTIRFSGMAAGGSITLLSANGRITEFGEQSGAGGLTAGGDVLLLASTGVSTRGIAASTAAGRFVTIGNSSMASLGGTPGAAFDTAPIFAANPVSVAGTILIGGPVTSGTFRAAATGDIGLGAVSAASAFGVRSDSGLLSLSDLIASPTMDIASADIAIGSGAVLDAGDTGFIRIASTSQSGMRIGGLSSANDAGYVLDRTEFAAINSGSVLIAAPDLTTTAVDLTVGDLDVTGPLAGSTIDSPTGTVRFFTGDTGTLAASGGIRVTGAIRARGFLSGNALVFSAGRFEMDAETGLIQTLGNGTALAGAIRLEAARVHVAQSSILARLRDDPLYGARVTDLNTPLGTARPDGVIRSASISFGDAAAILIQNTGTTALPAGLFALSSGILDRSQPPAAGSVDLVLNGQIQNDSGLVTSFDLVPLLATGQNRAFFTATSTINGCLVSAASCLPDEEPPQTAASVLGVILPADNLIAVQPGLDNSGPEIGSEGNEPEDERRRQAEEAAKRAPIAPPAMLISTQPLNPVIDVDEPVAGSGNPGLIRGGSVDTAIGRGKQ